MRALLVFGVLLTTTIAHAETSLAIPAGWTEDVQAGNAQRAQFRAARGAHDIVARMWRQPGDIGGVQLSEFVVSTVRQSADELIDEVERQTKVAMALEGEVSSSRKDEARRVTVEQTFELGDKRLRMRRHYVAAYDGMHIVMVSCVEATSGAACQSVFDNIRLNIKGVVDLDTARLSAIAYKLGQGLVFLGLPIALVILLVRRGRRRRAAAAIA